MRTSISARRAAEDSSMLNPTLANTTRPGSGSIVPGMPRFGKDVMSGSAFRRAASAMKVDTR
jgi:hypothetical protein